MYRKYRIVNSIASSVSQYESYRDQVYPYTTITDSSYFTSSALLLKTNQKPPSQRLNICGNILVYSRFLWQMILNPWG